jgi:hypothetical protein
VLYSFDKFNLFYLLKQTGPIDETGRRARRLINRTHQTNETDLKALYFNPELLNLEPGTFESLSITAASIKSIQRPAMALRPDAQVFQVPYHSDR